MKIPDKKGVETTVKNIFGFLFPNNEDLINLEINIEDKTLNDHLAVIFCGNEKKQLQFLTSLKSTRNTLIKDAEYILESDPAAKEIAEVIHIYPGFFAIYCYRIAHIINGMSIPLVSRIITEYAHMKTGIDIHPGATIGNPVSIDHGTGIVIGETARIGNHVKIYQGVTLGALSVDKSKALIKRHPTIEDNVILYAGCTILGGETVVGKNSIIGGNVWLTESIGPYSVVYHKSEIIVRNQSDFNEPINFVI